MFFFIFPPFLKLYQSKILPAKAVVAFLACKPYTTALFSMIDRNGGTEIFRIEAGITQVEEFLHRLFIPC